MSVLKKISDLFIKGALEKGGVWGGPECISSVSFVTHYKEFILWSCIILTIYLAFNLGDFYSDLKQKIIDDIAAIKKNNNGKLISSKQRFFEIIVGLIHMAICCHLFYCKYTISSLINLLQPCHVICFIQGIALLRNDHVTILISLFVLPALIGTLLAMLFPETNGLDLPFEIESYWIQHYFIQLVPIYLLIKANGLGLKYFSFKSVLMGVWILTFAHYIVFEIVDLLTHVNVEFMLCETGAMKEIFKLFPSWILYPSYRTFLGFSVMIFSFLISYLYKGIATIVHVLVSDSKPKKEIKKD